MSTKQTTISTSANGKMKQVVDITTIDGRKNNKGKPYKTSVTRHISTTFEDRKKK